MEHTLNLDLFRKQFPPFSDAARFDDAQIALNWEMATSHITAKDGPLLSGSSLQLALCYMSAHLLSLSTILGENASTNTGIVTSSQVDKVHVQISAPPFQDSWDYWLSQTAYGQQLLALLKTKSAGGFYCGGWPEKKPFRKVGGKF